MDMAVIYNPTALAICFGVFFTCVAISIAGRFWPLKHKERRKDRTKDYLRQYAIFVSGAFNKASVEYPSIRINENVMAGAPCIGDTRIPVYMVLDAIEGYVDLQVVRDSYPMLTIDQIRDAIGFAKVVVECPLG